MVARMRRFENLLALFQSGNAATLIDLPFVIILLVFVSIWGGWIVAAPLVAIVLLILSGVVITAFNGMTASRAASAQWRARELSTDTIAHAAAIRNAGAEGLWSRMLSETFEREELAAVRAQGASAWMASLGQSIIGLSAAATLGLGAFLVMEGAMSIGALMAATILNGRILGPVHGFLISLEQFRDLRSDLSTIEQMLKDTDLDERREQAVSQGALRVERVGVRLPDAPSFALHNASFGLRRGQRLALVGPAGSGKSTLLRTSIGLMKPTLGKVLLDGFELSNVESGGRRDTFAYAPRRPEFFYGTIAQNMRFTRIDISDDEIAEMFDALNLPLDAALFPEGPQTRLTAALQQTLNYATLQKMNIARAMLSRRPILALDNVFVGLTPRDRAAVLARLGHDRPHQSVLVISDQRDVIESCDVALALRDGGVVAYGPTSDVLAAITKS